MKIIKDKAIIIESIPIKRSDNLIYFFSKNSGMIKGIAEGARKVRSRFIGCFEALNYVEVSYCKREGEEVVKINECEIISSIAKEVLKEDYYYAIFYLIELAKEFGTTCKNIRFFNILENIHYGIIDKINLSLLVRWGELNILNEYGSLSLIEECTVCRKIGLRRKYISGNGALKCENCRSKDDIEISERLFILMNKLLYVKIKDLNEIIVEDADLKKIGMIVKYLIEHCIEKRLHFYDFYKQVRKGRER